jgi:hypothetical protein
MALVLKDRVKETSTTAGTGTLTLAGAVSGFQSFAAVGNGNTTYYAIADSITGDWEVGIGTYTSSGTTLSRTTVLSSSNGGALVSFAANPKDVFVTYPSEKSVYEDASNVVNATSFGAITATSAALTTGTITTAPVNNTDIVNKEYADAIASGIHFHEAVNLATTAALPANTYNNGTSGVGATLTGNANGALSVDSTLTVVSERILVKNEAAGANNGVYTVTQVGSAGTPYILTRATDFDSVGTGVNQIDEGDFFLVTSGTANVNTAWVQQTPPPITIGTTALVFQQFSAPITYTAGTGLTESPTYTFNIGTTGVTATTYGSASQVPVFAVNAQGQLTSVTNTAIAINGSAVSGNISGSAGSVANALTLGTYLTGTSYNGSSAVTAAVDATSTNTVSKVVARDSSGNFAAGTITAALSGNATTATTATNTAGGAANQISYNTAAGTTSYIVAPTVAGTYLNWNGSAFAYSALSLPNSLTINNGGAGGASGSTFNGSAALTISYNTVGAPSTGGTGATGTWGISISGNAATATSATSATSATTATNLAGGSAGTIPYQSAAGTTAMLAAGSSGQVLQSNGAAAPSWAAATAAANNGTLTLAVSGTGLSGSQTFTANQAGNATFTVTSNATNNNTASTIVARDASGNFSAGTITAALSGNASTATSATSATSATTATNLAGGSAGTVPYQSAAGTTVQLAAGTSGQVLRSNGAAAPSWVTATNANTASAIVQRDASGNFSAGTITCGNLLSGFATITPNTSGVSTGLTVVNGDITAYRTGGTQGVVYLSSAGTRYLYWDGTNYNLNGAPVVASNITAAGNVTGSSASCTGNAATATVLQTARTINGTSFNGSANITVTANTTNTLTLGSYLTGTSFNGSAAVTAAVDATSANTASKVVARDASGNFSAGTITAALNGNASTATSATYATSAGYSSYLITQDTRTLSPSSTPAYRLTFGFTSWNNNNTSPYADYLAMRSYADASGGNDNLLMLNKSAIAMRVYQQTFGSATAYSSYADVLMTNNYNSYAPTLTGTGASGTWGISITGNAATVGSLAINTSGRNDVANQIVRTDTNGYIQAGWINTTSGDNGTTAIDRVYASSDGYIRYYTPTNFRTVVGLGTASNVQFNSLGVGTAGSGTAGEIRATNNVTAYYSSDIKFKENVRDIPNAAATVKAIGGKLFDWKDDYIEERGGEDGYFVQKADFGIIAQDAQKHFPICVRTRPDGSLAVDYEKLSALALAAVAEQEARIAKLEALVSKLIEGKA